MTDRRERASVLMLMPAAVLIVVALGSIAVDFSIVYLGQRELAAAAAAAANDAATFGATEDLVREGAYEVDEDRAEAAAVASLAARGIDVEVIDVDVVVVSPTEVQVSLVGEVDYVFARAIPGVAHVATVRASATAVAAVP